MPPLIRSARADEVPAVAGLLAEAFESDPVMAAMLPDSGTRDRRLTRLFATEIGVHHLPGGAVDVAVGEDGVMGGAAVWDPPGRWHQGIGTQLRMLPGLVRALGPRALAGARMSQAFERAHPTTPHWFLSAIGTGRSARGGGFGSALLRSRLEVVDRDAMPAYLESSNVANISYYERFGFEAYDEIELVPARGDAEAVVAYAMWRDPR
ncbi:GNAT family N-acetyltransferase [Rhodococcus rhodnii]|uniref:Puromycin N-acetyltransferase n=2 Tax=Rhodococcus rhodnii TaxID=38312 RepID=R7WMC5_9NOCA|nr:GNAT family N-acetyltransferase [Rhodococcus rhodnii]EOM76448.1 puromycin N-acetyltransferase [Rhodococcus rhodnii LMG 5362]TXG91562.1 GNAT family N-acetyltransferase [Rhodococcus rhodnii]